MTSDNVIVTVHDGQRLRPIHTNHGPESRAAYLRDLFTEGVYDPELKLYWAPHTIMTVQFKDSR